MFLTAGSASAQTSPKPLVALKTEARAAADHRDWAKAAELYEQAAALAPRDASLRVALGDALMRAGRLADAISAYQAALKISPQSESAALGLAETYRRAHNYDEARRLLEKAHLRHPKSGAPLAALGYLEIELQTYDAAIHHLTAAVGLSPADVAFRDDLAAAYKAKGDASHALEQLDKVLARDPKNVLAHYLRGEIYADRNENERALSDAEQVVSEQAEKSEGRLLLAKILLRIPNCLRAVQVLEPLHTKQSLDSETLFLLSRAYQCAGQVDEAQKIVAEFEATSKLERAARENKLQAKHLVEQANERALKNDFSAALDLLQQALQKDPCYAAAYSQLAKIYYSEGDVERASGAIGKALEFDPFHPDFLYVQGKVFEKQGKLDEALAAFQRAALINPKESDAYFEMGVIYQSRNDRARARAAFRKAVELSPDDPEYRRALEALSAAPSSP